MEEFLNNLYSYKYFGTYLMISIVVLLLLFVIILFFGKKDQKKREVEATKKLQQINSEDTFKETSGDVPLEVNTPAKEENKLDDTIVVSNINDVPLINPVVEEHNETLVPNDEPLLNNVNTNLDNVVNLEEPVTENLFKEEVVKPNIENNNNIDNNIQVENLEPINIVNPPLTDSTVNPDPSKEYELTSPVLDKVEEKPFAFQTLENKVEDNNLAFSTPLNRVDSWVQELANSSTVVSDAPVPTFNFDEIVESVNEVKKEQTYNKGPEVFSSVYAPSKDEPKVSVEPSIDLPHVSVREEVKVPSKEELDIELPTLKKDSEKEMEMPALNNYDLDNLTGESYNVK